MDWTEWMCRFRGLLDLNPIRSYDEARENAFVPTRLHFAGSVFLHARTRGKKRPCTRAVTAMRIRPLLRLHSLRAAGRIVSFERISISLDALILYRTLKLVNEFIDTAASRGRKKSMRVKTRCAYHRDRWGFDCPVSIASVQLMSHSFVVALSSARRVGYLHLSKFSYSTLFIANFIIDTDYRCY